jgi:uncharacterized protein (UPF0335 family)
MIKGLIFAGFQKSRDATLVIAGIAVTVWLITQLKDVINPLAYYEHKEAKLEETIRRVAMENRQYTDAEIQEIEKLNAERFGAVLNGINRLDGSVKTLAEEIKDLNKSRPGINAGFGAKPCSPIMKCL